jgi:uncharacterized RDD family membrane protein YckC
MTEQTAVTPDSVYFDLRDYAHPLRRLLACAVDFALFLALFVGLLMLTEWCLVPKEVLAKGRTPEAQQQINKYMKPVQIPLPLGLLAACLAYHVALRRTRGGTIGHRLMRTRLVDKNGEPPPIRALFRRFLIAVPVTLFFGLSYLDCFRNPRRQATHDKWSGTWVVRCRAKPAGPAITSYHPKLLGTFLVTHIDLDPVTRESPVVATNAAQDRTQGSESAAQTAPTDGMFA